MLDQSSIRRAASLSYYNFCRIHKTLRVTPAMAAGMTERLWTVEDIVALVAKRESLEDGSLLVGQRHVILNMSLSLNAASSDMIWAMMSTPARSSDRLVSKRKYPLGSAISWPDIAIFLLVNGAKQSVRSLSRFTLK
jgi:hypothetical protein